MRKLLALLRLRSEAQFDILGSTGGTVVSLVTDVPLRLLHHLYKVEMSALKGDDGCLRLRWATFPSLRAVLS